MAPVARWIERVAGAALVVLALVKLGSAADTGPKPLLPPPAGTMAGELLVAAPGIGDPRFADTVIFIVRQNEKGALGIVINRPVGERPLADLLKLVGKDATGVTGKVSIFEGGPVEPEIGFVLHTTDYHIASTIPVDSHYAVTSNPDILHDIAVGKGPAHSLIAFGYAGWAPGQLESELRRHDWFIAPADPDLVFTMDRAAVWQHAFDRRVIEL